MAKTIREHTDSALDALYTKTAGPMLLQIDRLTNGRGSPLQAALTELDDEAERLSDEGKKFTPDNAVLRKTLDASETNLTAAQNLISVNDNAIQDAGVQVSRSAAIVKVLAGTGNLPKTTGNPLSAGNTALYIKALKAANIEWVGMTPDAFAVAFGFVTGDAWQAKMAKWGAGYTDLINLSIFKGISQGWSPSKTAAEIHKLVTGIPLSAAENLTRTLQLTAYRDASNAQTAGADFIEYKVRIARLDQATCLSCISLHGTRLEKGQRVEDHYRGRCDEIYKIRGVDLPGTMQADSSPGNRNFVPFQNGSEWFSGLPLSRQKQQTSFKNTPAKLNAFLNGVPLSDFVGKNKDPVFGDQIIEQGLKRAIGDDADQFYMGNQGDE